MNIVYCVRRASKYKRMNLGNCNRQLCIEAIASDSFAGMFTFGDCSRVIRKLARDFNDKGFWRSLIFVHDFYHSHVVYPEFIEFFINVFHLNVGFASSCHLVLRHCRVFVGITFGHLQPKYRILKREYIRHFFTLKFQHCTHFCSISLTPFIFEIRR